MKNNQLKQKTPRRQFLETIAAGAATIGFASIAVPARLDAKPFGVPEEHDFNNPTDPDAWFSQLKGKHRIVFDATQPHELFPFAWPKVFMLTNDQTGTPANDCGVVLVLRHSAICYAFEDRLWDKYHFGEVFKADDPKTKQASLRNPFWNPKPGDFKVPGIGEVAIGINELQAEGVMVCVCSTAITVYSAAVAGGMNVSAEEVKKDWMSGLLPGIQVVPSGVWALGRAQELGCGYIFAG
ncbi:MAG: hypothetical protein DYG98_24335 [Haliscomenobacteraceae bacterium CHB4]|nr:hypothetical protein [Saprospiraceae bacterium]MCE7926187.1 hypothetical protein [Haliscomenobacteraceae bacterium CHB4]